MVAAQRNDYSMDDMESKYNSITGLYDLADDLLATVESPFVKNAEEQMDIVEPMIAEIGDATDILAEEFIHIADSYRGAAPKANKMRIENAMRKIFNALNDYQDRVKEKSSTLKNIADGIVDKIQRKMEEIIVMFFEFIQISLASIMHKQQLETVRVRNPQIALMMHQHAMQQQ